MKTTKTHERTRRFARCATPIVAATLYASCSPCPSPSDIDQWLDQGSRCVMVDQPPMNTTCQPTAGTICTVVGTGIAGLGADGTPGIETETYLPQDVVVDQGGLAYYTDWNNHQIRLLDTRGRVQVIAGTGELNDIDSTENAQSTGDRTPQLAIRHRLNHPTSVTFDRNGRLMIAAWHSAEIKRIDLGTGMLETIIGNGTRGFAGDGGDAADLAVMLRLPVNLAFDSMGNMFIADAMNQRVRRVDAVTNIISTVVGSSGMPGFAGDNGPALDAQINNPGGVQDAKPGGRLAIDSHDNIYIADTGNHRIRRVDTHVTPWTITTIAGTGTAGFDGDGGPATAAQLNAPADVEVDAAGVVYVADTQNSCVRTIGTDGVIRTVAGRCGVRGFGGDGASPTDALLNRPGGIGLESNGNLWIVDTNNQRIRLVCAANGGQRCQPGS